MRSKNSFKVFTNAYSLVRSTHLLETRWANRAFVSSYFLYKRFWEDPFRGLIHCRPGLFENGDVLDIGANIGYTACLFAAALDPGFKVYSFEPDRSNLEMMAGVIRRKRLSEKIIAMNAAVGDIDGSIEFWHNKDHSGDHRVVTHHFKNTRADYDQISTVPMISIDCFAETRRIEKISFIKIDVQGYELAVCEGMARTLEQFPGACICCEYAPDGIRELGFDPARLLDFFSSRGYRLHILTRSSIALVHDLAAIHQVAGKAGYVDLLCSRNALT